MGTDAKSVVRLSISERVQLEALLAEPRVAKDRALRARMLLMADVDGRCGWPGVDRFADCGGVRCGDDDGGSIATAVRVGGDSRRRWRHGHVPGPSRGSSTVRPRRR